MVGWLIENTLITAGIVAMLFIACRYLRLKPAVCHLLWVLVLIRLVAPPVQVEQWPVATAFQSLRTWTNDVIDAQFSPPLAAMPALETRSKEQASVDRRKAAMALPSADADQFACQTTETLDEIVQYGALPNKPENKPRPLNMVSAYAPPQNPAAAPPAPRSSPGPSQSKATSHVDMSDDQLVMTQHVMLPTVRRGNAPTATENSGAALSWTLGLKRDQIIPAILLLAWMLGSLILGTSQATRILLMHRRVCRDPLADETLTAFVRKVAGRLQVAVPRIRVSHDIDTPMIWCLGRPTLLWPAAWATEEGLVGREGVVAHELAHIRRRDHWVAWFDLLAMTVMWWNPLVWLARHRIHHYSELACDAWVVNTLPGGRRRYAESILDALEGIGRAKRLAPALGLAASSNKREVQRRLTLIVRENVSCRLSPTTGLVAVLIAGLLLPRWVVASGPVATSLRTDAMQIDASLNPEIAPIVDREVLRFNARRCMDMKRFDQALPYLHQLAACDANDGEAHHLLGIALLTQHKFHAAAAAFEHCHSIGHRPAVSLYNLACCKSLVGEDDAAIDYLQRSLAAGFDQHELFVQGDPDLANVRTDPRFAEIEQKSRRAANLRDALDTLLQSDSWASAAPRARELAALTPDDPRAHGTLGFVMLQLGELTEAADAFARQIALDGDAGSALYHLACIAARHGNTQRALEHLEAAVDAGFSDGRMIRHDAALESLRMNGRLLEAARRADMIHRMMREAELAREYDDWQQVREIAQQMLAVVPNDQCPSRGWAFSQMAAADVRLNRLSQSAAARREQIKCNYQIVDASIELAAVMVAARDHEAALAHLRAAVDMGFEKYRAIAHDPRFEPLHDDHRFHRIVHDSKDRVGLTRMGAVNWQDLHDMATQALIERPSDIKQLTRLGWSQMRMGMYEQARATFTQINEITPSPFLGCYNIACCHALEGNLDAAIKYLQTAMDEFEPTAESLAVVRFDPDLANLWDDPRFETLMRAMTARMDGGRTPARTATDVI